MNRILSAFLSLLLIFQPVWVQASVVAGINLPPVGEMVHLSASFQPALLRGMTIDPVHPLRFDFILDSGAEALNDAQVRSESQRMINYFLAALTVPQKDLWVNLSPVEKDRILPDALIKTELGRDLLGQDYILKQLTASLIYPEDELGKAFWQRVYDEAYTKFGVTEVPVDAFNKVWIVPERASVFEKGNTVYIAKAHLKVMLEADYVAANQRAERDGGGVPDPVNPAQTTQGAEDLAKQILREVIVPAIEQEVNEGKNFARLRQVVYSLILSQWYQDVLKGGVFNKVYSGKSKVAGIDVSDPESKQRIYEQYLAAYKKGVFNYIKEETDRVSQEPMPKKYFSGGFVVPGTVPRDPATPAMALEMGEASRISVNMEPATPAMEQKPGEPQGISESHEIWNDPNRPIGLLDDLKGCWEDGTFKRANMLKFLDRYTAQVDSEAKLYPVEAPWPIFKAFALLTKKQKKEMVQALKDEFQGKPMTLLVEGLLLINNVYSTDWAKMRTPHLLKRQIYLVAAEIHHWAGGLGPVMKFLGKMMKELGLNASYIAPWYQNMRANGETIPLDYSKNAGVKITNENFDEYEVDIGDKDNENQIYRTKVRVAEGVDENGVTVYMFRDVQKDGTSRYTNMLYHYDQKYNNYITKDETMAFINVAAAKLILRLEEKRKIAQPDAEPAVVHSNDGQLAPLQAVTMSWYGQRKAIKDIVWAFTTHTYVNRGEDGLWWGISRFLKHMMGVTGRFINVFRQKMFFGSRDGVPGTKEEHIDHTSSGVGLADVAFAVAGQHRDRVQTVDPGRLIKAATNGAAPEEMGFYLRKELTNKGVDLEDPTAQEIREGKKSSKRVLNEMARSEKGIKRHNGEVLKIDEDAVLFGCARRAVLEKAAMFAAFTKRNIYRLVQGILDRRHMEIKFSALGVDGGGVFDWLLQKGYLKTVGRITDGRYYDTDKDFSKTEGRLYPVDMTKLKGELEQTYGPKAQQIYDVLEMVLNRRKVNVTPFLNDQGGGSVKVLEFYGNLENEIAKAKADFPDQFPGDFQFVSSFLPEHKKVLLSAEDNDVKDSWLGANEVTEEDAAANGTIQTGTDEGAIIRQGIRLTETHSGNVLPAVSEDDFWENYLILLEMSPERLAENQRVSYQLGRTVMLAVRTASANALGYEDVLVRRENESREDAKVRAAIIERLGGDGGVVKSILEQGRNGVTTSFVFSVQGQGDFPADPENKLNGLRSFIEKKNALEELYGYDALLWHFLSGKFQERLSQLFHGLPSEGVLGDWLAALDKDQGTPIEKYKRFGRFLEDLEGALEDRMAILTVDQKKAKFILNEIGSPGMNFIWKKDSGSEVDKNGPGLRAFVDAFDRMKGREDVVHFHSMGGTSHLLIYLADLLRAEPLMTPLRYRVEKRLELFKELPPNKIEERIDLTFQTMELARHYVQVLEKIADPTKEGAMNVAAANTGGIDARNIGVDRTGDLIQGAVSDEALEAILAGAPGVKAVIMNVTPISDLRLLLGLSS
ncbi:MAG: glycogen/starch synthase [Candidatus Omnitrophica bacterium]|nr:glycogen/starch synthase [Candidatus Omnitrophota bacterium]